MAPIVSIGVLIRAQAPKVAMAFLFFFRFFRHCVYGSGLLARKYQIWHTDSATTCLKFHSCLCLNRKPQNENNCSYKTLAQADSNKVHNKKKIERFSFFLLFKFFCKTYLVELILDGLSDFHQNCLISSADHAGKDLWNLNRLVKPFSNNV